MSIYSLQIFKLHKTHAYISIFVRYNLTNEITLWKCMHSLSFEKSQIDFYFFYRYIFYKFTISSIINAIGFSQKLPISSILKQSTPF